MVVGDNTNNGGKILLPGSGGDGGPFFGREALMGLIAVIAVVKRSPYGSFGIIVEVL